MMDANSTNPYAPPFADSHLSTRVHHTFCGLQPFWTQADRFYKFYVTKDALYAGWIGGQFHDKLSVRCQLSPLYLVLVGFVVAEPIAMWIDNRRRRLQSLYDSLIAEPDNFLAVDRRNFLIARKSIQSITISSRKSSWTFWANSGIMKLNIHGHDPIRVIIRDARDLGAIVDEMVAAGYTIQIENDNLLRMSVCIGALGGLAFWVVFVALCFGVPDRQSSWLGLMISPCCSATFGCLLGFAAWSLIKSRRGDNNKTIRHRP